jgi:hypothetical protein
MGNTSLLLFLVARSCAGVRSRSARARRLYQSAILLCGSVSYGKRNETRVLCISAWPDPNLSHLSHHPYLRDGSQSSGRGGCAVSMILACPTARPDVEQAPSEVHYLGRPVCGRRRLRVERLFGMLVMGVQAKEQAKTCWLWQDLGSSHQSSEREAILSSSRRRTRDRRRGWYQMTDRSSTRLLVGEVHVGTVTELEREVPR